MGGRILKGFLFILVFIGGVWFFSSLSLMNRQQAISASDLSDPTLPVMYIDVGGIKADRMFGFRMEMDARNMRKCLVPVSTRRSVRISYKAYENTVKSVSYEISAPDTGEIVENAKIANFQPDGDYMTGEFVLSEPILMNREYPVRFTIQTENGDIYYYARVIQRSDPITDKYVQFVYDFYEGCMNSAGSGDVNTYLETDETITNNSYTNVNIKSSLRMVTWGSLNPQIMRKAVPTICDMAGETCSLTNEYLISAEGNYGQEIYHVSEFYRLRYYNGRMMLLNFNRKALQVFNPLSPGTITAPGIGLGISENNVQYLSNATSDTVAFVQDGSVWEYSSGSNRLSSVFSMRSVGDGTDERDDNSDYGVKLIRISEGGALDFTVYGYMSRGAHEGSMGVSVCHYNPESAVVTERAFIPYDRSFMQLEKDMEKLNYISTSGRASFYLCGTVYEVDLSEQVSRVILTQIHPDAFASSASMSRIAWMDEMLPYGSHSITVMDLETGSTRRLQSDNGAYMKLIGFLNDDLIYGLANEEDVAYTVSGQVIFAMNTLRIEDAEGQVMKEYSPPGLYVTDVDMEPGLAKLTRVQKDGNTYTSAEGDNIVNNQQTGEGEVQVSLGNNSRQGTVVTLKLPRTIANINPSVNTFRIRVMDSEGIHTDEQDPADVPLYYVYTSGTLEKILTDPAEAVQLADEHVGIVLNDEGQYIYERGNKQTKTELNNADIPEAFLSGEIRADQLQNMCNENIKVLDLSGCTLDQVLYQLSQGRAVVTRLGDGSVAVIVGYDRYNTLQYNFETGEHFYMGINDSTNAMLEGGNVFVSYIESRATIKENE